MAVQTNDFVIGEAELAEAIAEATGKDDIEEGIDDDVEEDDAMIMMMVTFSY